MKTFEDGRQAGTGSLMRRAAVVGLRLVLAALLWPLAPAQAQSQLEEVEQAALRRNYSACMSGYLTCKRSLLTGAQIEEVEQAARKRNYTACLSGYTTCNKSQLTESQLEDVEQAALRRNYSACMSGYLTCNRSRLTAREADEVAQAALRRNYTACVQGYTTCNRASLTDAQREEADQAALRRNYSACMSGYLTCNKSLLSKSQVDEARQAELRRNYQACLAGQSNCNKSLLTSQEAESASRERRTAGGATERAEPARQQVAEERQGAVEETYRREPPRAQQRINLQVSHTEPTAEGDFTIVIKTNADTASLKIDGIEQGGRQDGSYVIRRVARAGQTSNFTIVARDVYGNSADKSISVTRAIMDSAPAYAQLDPAKVRSQRPRDAVAIIIGIQNYKRIPRADFANNDARVFYDYAIRALGVRPTNIKLLLDEQADDVEIYRAFQNWLPQKVRKNATDVYVFYSGHGLPSEDGKSLFLLPHGVDKELIEKTAIRQEEVVSAIRSAQPRSVTMFMDACYSGQMRSGDMLVAGARPVSLKPGVMSFPLDFTVITAAAPDQIASSSPELRHGIFSYYLMKGLEGEADENADGRITAAELQAYTADMVARQALALNRRQQPQLIGDANRVLVGP